MFSWLGRLVQPVLNFLGGPVVQGVVDSYKAKLTAANATEKIASDLAGRELDLQQRESELSAQYRISILGRWYEPVNLFGYVLVVYFGKVFLWDAAFHLGSTDAVHGIVGDWAGMIMMFLVGKRGAENIARILRR